MGSDYLNNKQLNYLCIAWRKGLRRVWRCQILPRVIYWRSYLTVYLRMMNYVVLCRRFLNFIISCMNRGSELVRFFVWFGLQQACMKSLLGRNARF